MTIIKYNHQGDYITSTILDYHPASINIVNDKNFIITSAYQSDEDKFIIYDCNTLNKLYSFLPINQKQTTWRHIYGQSNFYHFNDEILFHEPMDNCIYQVRNSSLTPRLQFDILGRNIT